MQYLVTMSFVETGALLSLEQTARMIRRMILPSLETLERLESEGKSWAEGTRSESEP